MRLRVISIPSWMLCKMSMDTNKKTVWGEGGEIIVKTLEKIGFCYLFISLLKVRTVFIILCVWGGIRKKR